MMIRPPDAPVAWEAPPVWGDEPRYPPLTPQTYQRLLHYALTEGRADLARDGERGEWAEVDVIPLVWATEIASVFTPTHAVTLQRRGEPHGATVVLRAWRA